MASRPKIFLMLATVYILIAIAMPIQIVALYGHGVAEWPQILSKLTILNWLVIATAFATASLLATVSPWLKYGIPAAVVIVGLNNLAVGYMATDYSPALTFMATVAFCLLNTPLLTPRLRFLIQHPQQRWWLTKPRRQVELPVKVTGSRSYSLTTATFDISESGLFIPLGEDDEWWKDFSSSDLLRISLGLSYNRLIRCKGKIARVAPAKGRYPSGVGIQFVGLSPEDRRQLRDLTHHST